MMAKWDQRFLDLAQHVSGWSKDPSTRVGAAITRGKFIVSLGFNGFPSGIADDDRIQDRPTKYKIVIHAEENAILSARQDLRGTTLYVVPLLPCSSCAAKIIQVGITRVVARIAHPDAPERWAEQCAMALALFREAGIQVEYAEQAHNGHNKDQ